MSLKYNIIFKISELNQQISNDVDNTVLPTVLLCR